MLEEPHVIALLPTCLWVRMNARFPSEEDFGPAKWAS